MDDKTQPKLVNRRDNRKSTFRMGRTIGEKREKLETANERAAARKKDKQKKATRIALTVIGFLILIIILIILAIVLISNNKVDDAEVQGVVAENYQPTIEIIDEDNANGQFTSRMKSYIGQAEKDFKDLNYIPVKAVIPSAAIREVDFYLEGKPGFIKMVVDRETAVSVEDADRMIRYLEGTGVGEYEYIDVRIEGKAYWK